MPGPTQDADGWSWLLSEEAPLKARIARVLETNRMACEFQPIVRTDTEEVFGYEALARFTLDGTVVPPNQVFDSLHDDRTLFFMLESRMKSFQIANRPPQGRLFLNLDPDVCEEGYQLEHWCSLFEGNDELVVEIIENTNVTNLENIRRFMATLNGAGIRVALDDIGGSRNLFSFELLEHCNALKFDRRWFLFLERDPAYRKVLEGLIAFAQAREIDTVLEGVESRRHLSLARDLGADFVQGYLFIEDFVTASSVGRGKLVEERSPVPSLLEATASAGIA